MTYCLRGAFCLRELPASGGAYAAVCNSMVPSYLGRRRPRMPHQEACSEGGDGPEASLFSGSVALKKLDDVQTIGAPEVASTGAVQAFLDDASGFAMAVETEATASSSKPAAALLWDEAARRHWRLGNLAAARSAFDRALEANPSLLRTMQSTRHLAALCRDWTTVVRLYDSEIAATPSRGPRAKLLVEKAAVLSEHLQRGEEAALALEECLDLEPEDLELLLRVERGLAARARYKSLVRAYEIIADKLAGAAGRSLYFTLAGLITEHRFGDAAAAARLFRAAFGLHRSDPNLLSAMKRTAERAGSPIEELVALAAEAAIHGETAAPTYLQIARAYENLGRNADAHSALLAAQRACPSDTLVLSELARLYESAGRRDDLVETLTTWAEIAADTGDFVPVNLRLAALLEDLERYNLAVERYQLILARFPGHPEALASLGKLYHRTSAWEGLLLTYEMEAAATSDPVLKALRLYKAGETLEVHLGRFDEAASLYRRAVDALPTCLPAFRALSRLLERLGHWESLIALRELEVSQATSPGEQVTALMEIATLLERRLGDASKAVEAIDRALALQPNHAMALAFAARLNEQLGRWRPLIDAQQRLERLTGDTRTVVALAHRTAEILDERLGDRAAAIVAWERVLSLAPSYPAALRALGRLYTHAQAWSSLIKMYRSESRLATDPRHAAVMLSKVGELYESALGDSQLAIDAYREALTHLGGHVPSMRALARLYRQSNSWRDLMEILQSQADTQPGTEERANLLFQAAGVCESQLGQPQAAIAAYEKVLEVAPQHAAAFLRLEHLHAANGNADGLLACYERQVALGGSRALSALLKLAQLHLDGRDDRASAAKCCLDVLERDPGSLAALKLLERADPQAAAHPRLRSAVAAQQADPTLATALTTDWTFTDALEASPDGVEEGLRHRADTHGLLAHYARLRIRATDPSEAFSAQLKLIDVHAKHTGDLVKALDACDAALKLQPHFFPVLWTKAALALRHEQPVVAKAVLIDIGESSLDEGNRRRAFLEAARIAGFQQNDPDAGIALAKRAGDGEGTYASARDLIDKLSARKRGARQYADWLLQRAPSPSGAPSGDLLVGARELLEDPANSPLAMPLLERALKEDPSNLEAARMLGDLEYTLRGVRAAIRTWEEALEKGADSQESAAIHQRLGAHLLAQGVDPGRAVFHLERALEALGTSAEEGGEASKSAVAIHRLLLEALPARPESLKALFRLWRRSGARDRSFLAARALAFFGHDDSELGELVAETPADKADIRPLGETAFDTLLEPNARGPMIQLLQIVAEGYLNDARRSADGAPARLFTDSSDRRALDVGSRLFGLGTVSVRRGTEGLISSGHTLSPSILVGPDVARPVGTIATPFLLGRALFGEATRIGLTRWLSEPDLADLLGNTIRIVEPTFTALGHRDEDQMKRLRRSYSRKTLKQLEKAAIPIASQGAISLNDFVRALGVSGDRAGLLVCGDVGVALSALLEADAGILDAPLSPHARWEEFQAHPGAQELLRFSLSDDYFELRYVTGLARFQDGRPRP